MSEEHASSTPPRPPQRLFSAQVMLGVVLAASFVLRARMLAIPLDRDEGVYATIGWSILQGISPYSGPVDLQMPGLWLLYAGVMGLFGANSTGVHVGLLVVNLTSTGLVYLLGTRLFDPIGGVVAAAGFAALSLSERMLGFTANAEHFIVVFALAGSLALLRASDSRRRRDFFLAGLLAGCAMVVKQQGVFFTGFVGAYSVYLLAREKPRFARPQLERLGLVVAGAAAPLAAFGLWFLARGVFGEFYFWSVRYSVTYGASKSLADGIDMFREIALPIVPHVAAFGVLALVGLWVGVFDPGTGKRDRDRTVFLAGFSVFAILAILPGLHFRHHYFLLLTPAVGLLDAAAVAAIQRWARATGQGRAGLVATGIVGMALVQWAVPQRNYLFRMTPDGIAGFVYQTIPMTELEPVADFIQARSAPEDTLLVLGSEPQLYLYAQRYPATTLIVMYPMMWAPEEMALELQRRTIREAEAAAPKFVVFMGHSSSWAKRAETPTLIFDWINAFSKRHYRKVGRVDLDYPRPSQFSWGEAAVSTQPTSEWYIWVLERISDPSAG